MSDRNSSQNVFSRSLRIWTQYWSKNSPRAVIILMNRLNLKIKNTVKLKIAKIVDIHHILLKTSNRSKM